MRKVFSIEFQRWLVSFSIKIRLFESVVTQAKLYNAIIIICLTINDSTFLQRSRFIRKSLPQKHNNSTYKFKSILLPISKYGIHIHTYTHTLLKNQFIGIKKFFHFSSNIYINKNLLLYFFSGVQCMGRGCTCTNQNKVLFVCKKVLFLFQV